MSIELETPALAPHAHLRWVLFVAGISIATLVPFMVMPLAAFYGSSSEALVMSAVLITFVGGHAHVASSAYFYFDPKMRSHLEENSTRYYLAPIALVAGTAIAYATTPPPYDKYILLAYFVWQTYHYQRQNFGILSFFAAGTDRVPVQPLERWCLNIAVLSGILALVKIYSLTTGTLLEPYADAIYRFAGLLYLTVPVMFVAALARTPKLASNPVRLLALVTFSAFYVFSFVFEDPSAATLGYALAHGLQYHVFMYFVGSSRARPHAALGTIVFLALAGGLALTAMQSSLDQNTIAGRMVFGAALGLIMSHFVIDAGIWRLREKFQREYMKGAFLFVFRR